MGTSETMARVRLLGIDELQPGEEGWIQLELQDAVVCARGDAFILRMPSPAETLGGGTIVDPHPPNRHKRFDESVLRTLRGLMEGTPADILLQTALSVEPAPVREIVRRSRLTAEAASVALTELVASGMLVGLESGAISTESETLLLSSRALESITQAIEQALVGFHAKYPLRRGMPREELRNHLELAAHPFQAILGHLETGGRVVARAGLVGLSSHAIHLTPTQQDAVNSLMQRFECQPERTAKR